MRRFIIILALIMPFAAAQSLGGAGTVEGVVTDPSGAAIPQAAVELNNPITGYKRTAQSDNSGNFRFTNIPPNPYHIAVSASGFQAFSQDLTVRTAVPISVKATLTITGGSSTVTVEAGNDHMLENVPYAHNDLDRAVFDKLPTLSPGSSLSDAIILSTPGVAADSNGFFHPLGDHAQVTYSVDGQPISDQQSKQFSTQIPLNAIQSMELITGSPNAEFGDKTSLVVNAQTRSGLGQKAFGRVAAEYGSFGTLSEEASLGFGSAKIGNFLVVNSIRSGRFLDTPEFRPYHDIGNNGTIFDRFDFQPSAKDAFHLNLFAARNWFEVPNTLDQPNQDQRQRALTFNIAPGYQHTFNAQTLLTISPFYRQDQVNYYPSNDLFADTPATLAQQRRLANFGVKADVAYTHGRHNLKIGTQLMQTRLGEAFTLGLTDASFNAVCVNSTGDPQGLPSVTDPSLCGASGFTANPALNPGLVPFDLTRGGSLFHFNGSTNVTQAAFYAQDSMTFGNLTVNAGLRFDHYDGLSQANSAQPRGGFSYLVKRTGTVLRGGYTRSLETPYNENLVLSSSTGQGGLAQNIFGATGTEPIHPGRRNQFNTGLQQRAGKYLLVDADYFWKFTDNAFDFGTLLNTPIEFPISWRKSKLDGVAVRVSTTDIRGFQAYMTMGHTRARYFGPSNGGLIFDSPLDTAVFRIDHDQAFQQTTHLRYQRPNNGPWVAFTWRSDSGLVAGAVPDIESALALTGAQQAAIGFFCGSQFATPSAPITSCASGGGATRLKIPAAGTEDDDHNPPRVSPRNVFDVAAGTENLFHTEHMRTTLRFTVSNLTNEASLYNFLSTFSGTHFVTPRSYSMQVGLTF